MQEENWIRWVVIEIQALQAHKYCKLIEEISHFFKDFPFFPFSSTIKINPALHISNSFFFHVQEEKWIRCGLLRYRLYKLMSIASLYKKIHIFANISFFFSFSRRIKINPPSFPIAQLQYMFFPCASVQLNPLRGLRRYRPYKIKLKSVRTRTDGRTDRTEYNRSLPLKRRRGTERKQHSPRTVTHCFWVYIHILTLVFP